MSTYSSIRPPRTPWVITQLPRPDASVRLICFPFAGGGASSYRSWSREMPAHVEVLSLQFPGHENRYAEAPLTRMDHLVEQLIEALTQFLTDLPFVLFGHSLGGIVALEVTRGLARRQRPLPAHVFISGRSAPHLPLRRVPVAQLSREELRAWLRSVRGTSEAVLQSREMMDVVLPVMRADLQMDDTYRSAAEPALPCPLTVLGGFCDEEVKPEQLREWAQYTSESFSLCLLDGDHFFPFNESRPSVLALLTKTIGMIPVA